MELNDVDTYFFVIINNVENILYSNYTILAYSSFMVYLI